MAPNGINGHAHDEEDEDLEIDYSDIEQKYAVHAADPLDSVVVIDGTPIVTSEEKKEKLLGVLVRRIAQTSGVSLQPEDIHMPFDESGSSKGFAFVTCPGKELAEQVKRSMDGLAFTKTITFAAYFFKDVQDYAQTADEYVAPADEEYQPRGHLRNWLADPAGRDQASILVGDTTQISWHTRGKGFEVAHERKKWTEFYTQWSPQGTYFTTIHAQGVAAWTVGGAIDRVNRFPHPRAQLIDYSPNERYIVTWSPVPIEAFPNGPFEEDDVGNMIAIWEVLTGQLKRTFPMPEDPSQGEEAGAPRQTVVWPMFKWSGDERYLARVIPDQAISVYETPGFGLLEKKSIKIEGVKNFEWCPLGEKEKDEIEAEEAAAYEAMLKEKEGGDAAAKVTPKAREAVLAYWTPEHGNQPARVSLLSVPGRVALRSKNLFNVSDCKLHWQSNGDFLCVKVDRHTKTKKTTFANLEIFRMREKDYPVEVLEIKDTVLAFAWEPKGDRFMLLTSNDPVLGAGQPGVTIKTSASFYQLDARKGNFRLLKTFDGKTSNAVFWSPKGRHLVLATLGSATKADVEFWDLDLEIETGAKADKDDPAAANIHLVETREHYSITQVEWDPSGRYVATVASTWQNATEPGYVIWDFKGLQLVQTNIDSLKQFVWRPRPRPLLSKDHQKRVRKNLKEFSRQFEEEDQLEESNVSAELLAHRKRLVEEWNAWRRKRRGEIEEERKRLGRDVPLKLSIKDKTNEAEKEVVEEWVEEIIEEKEEILP